MITESPERRELHELREGNNARAGWEALPALQRTERLPDTERADFPKVEFQTRRGLCLCCGEQGEIPVAMHVCVPCFQSLEGER